MTETSAGHKIVHIDDVEPNRRRGGDLRVLLSPKTVGSTTGFMGVTLLEPGDFVAEHYHPYSDEYMYVARGTIVARLDGEDIEMRAGQGVLAPKFTRHRVENIGTEPAQIVFHLCPLAPRPELGHVDTEERSGES
ncbi:cupin domain-containing protein [Spongiactinospora gelatinilytica]|uniref:Cupin domain-containing protein n=1 Tax=Spongiactinospora gelatinilytica TaxID=2666298 RepID=A0A2W2HI63_9ACTN|nr:cupin domain-containing protein [Spongiactinospora gelatinilytica]PZG51365.1 cupin domain-containing protein [Spongiactinospora gelatinilytica]